MFGFGKKKKFEPITVEKEYGKFTMGHDFNDRSKPEYEYEGIVDWCGHETEVSVRCDNEDSLTANVGFARLDKLLADAGKAEKLDSEMKDYTFNEIVQSGDIDYIIYWDERKRCQIENPERITKEQFLEQIKLRYIMVYEDGNVEFDFVIFSQLELMMYIDDDGNIDDWEMTGDFWQSKKERTKSNEKGT